MTLWQGRFGSEDPAQELLAYSVSLPYDRRLAHDDVVGSRAHVRGLAAAGLLSSSESKILLAALNRVADELSTDTLVFQPGDEDVHTAVERRVTEIAGEVGARLHTGRSRNDQIATDLRLFAKRELLGVAYRIQDLQAVLLQRAQTAEDIYLPGYTHLQRAQPVLLAHHLLAHGWAFARDVDRLVETRRRLDVSPLGAGALAGSSLPLDPDRVAAELGFAATFENSLDAVSDRDFVAEALFDLALTGVHLSRLGEEMVLWSSEEFGFVDLADAYATGSSMLPQKKNPDIAELARGRSGRLIGHLTGLLATLKGLPLAYNRDLQEDKEPLFDALDQLNAGLRAMTGLLRTATWNATRMRAAADTPFVAAVDLAEWLVERGMPFRQAHAVVGGLVRDAVERHVPLAELVEAHPSLGAEAVELLAPGVAVTRRTTPGGAGPGPVAVQLVRFAEHLAASWPDCPPTREALRPPGRRRPASRTGAVEGSEAEGITCALGLARRRLHRSFYAGDALTVAPQLLNKLMATADGRVGRIVEVEAYHGEQDPASHAFRGRTARNAVMYGPPGHLYVYLSYGLHWCANVVCGPPGEPQAVLLRALEPIDGLDLMRRARWRDQRRQDDRDLCRGPGRLCQALGIDRSFDGADLVGRAATVWLADDGVPAPDHPLATPRVGISVAADRLWRFAVKDHPAVGAHPRPAGE